MSRSGFGDGEPDDNASMLRMYRWGHNVEQSIKGKRGQVFLDNMVKALDAMPVKELEADTFEDGQSGCACALGEIAKFLGIVLDNNVAEACDDHEKFDPDCNICQEDYGEADGDWLAKIFGISRTLALEIVHENDEAGARDCRYIYGPPENPETLQKRDREARYRWVHGWAKSRIQATQPSPGDRP